MTQEQGFAEMAQNAVSAYLRYGYDQRAGAYYGRLQVADGKPILGEKVTTYQPREYAGIWEVLFPTHDYPMSLAESTLSLYALTGGEEFQAGARRWIQIIAKNMPAREGKGAYAEQYGRCIHFLVRASQVFGEAEYLELAHRLAEEATEQLFAFGMFRGHPGEDRYDAVDGVGYLALALLYLETGEPPDMMGSGF